MTIWSRLQGRLSTALGRARGGLGHIDGRSGGRLLGWAARGGAGGGALRVGMFGGRRFLAGTVANIFRGDLLEAGIGDGHHGFAFALTPELLSVAARAGGVVTLRALDPPGHEIGSLPLTAPAGAVPPRGQVPAALQDRLFGAMAALSFRRELPMPDGAAPALEPHALLFEPLDPARGGFAYGAYLRDRFGLPDGDGRDFLRWYLRHYGGLRNGLRVPMPARMIAELNAPAGPGGLSLATLLLQESAAEGEEDFEAIYRWAARQAREIHSADCLVPDRYADGLAGVPAEWQGRDWAPSRYMLRLRADEPALAALDLGTHTGRRWLALSMLALAVADPCTLRYLPAGLIERALDERAGESPFSAFVRAQSVPGAPVLTREDYAAALRLSGYDLNRGCFASLTVAGDRLEAAALPPVPGPVETDVQIIGPFGKSSGLGQAARLSALMLDKTGLRINRVDFDLDNPAPDQAAAGTGPCRRARVNLIHLNAGSVPLAFAYLPDVFSGAYNIGYFFWELDSPADCHRLGMDLLDEIWVSGDYGVEIYRPATRKPVTNVGMCVAEMPEVDRAQARTGLRARFGFAQDSFVFFLSFDSFSFVRRKNPAGAVRAFRDAFPNDPGVRLVIKTQNRRRISDPAHRAEWDGIEAAMRADPRIAVLDETMDHAALWHLMAGCDAYLSLHRSEGWGFGMIEAMALRVPVVCTAYSGNMAFCNDDTAFLVGASRVEAAQGDYIFVRPGQCWGEPDHAQAVAQLRAVRGDATLRDARVGAAWRNVQDRFTADAVARRYAERLHTILAGR